MSKKTFPLSKDELEEIIKKYPTPFHIYDEHAIRENIRKLQKAFAWAPRFREQFAVKALPNPRILQVLHEEGAGTDNSSLAELVLSDVAGYKGEEILLTSNDTPADEFQKAIELGAIINLDDISHLDYLEKNAGLPEIICFRYNPGDLIEGNDIIGKPTEAKYGLTRDQLFEAYKMAKEKGDELRIAICIGAQAEVLLAAATSMDFGADELEVASAMHQAGHGTPLRLGRCDNGLAVPADCDYVLEGRITFDETEEGPFVDITGTYDFVRKQPIIKIDRIWSCKDPIMHILLPGGWEH